MQEDEGRWEAAGKRFDILPCWEECCLRMQPVAPSHFWFLLLQLITVLYIIATYPIWVLSFSWNCPKYSCPVRALGFFTFWQFACVSFSKPRFLLLPHSFQTTVFELIALHTAIFQHLSGVLWSLLQFWLLPPLKRGTVGCSQLEGGYCTNLKRRSRNRSYQAAGASMLINHTEMCDAFKRGCSLNKWLESTNLWHILELF